MIIVITVALDKTVNDLAANYYLRHYSDESQKASDSMLGSKLLRQGIKILSDNITVENYAHI